MARKHEHFGLSYLEELNIVRERENICKESRQEFLKFKQETVTAPSNLIQPVLKVEAADESYQSIPCSSQSSGSALFLLQVPDPFYELGTSNHSRKVRICSVPDTMTQKQSLPTQQKKSHKKECADKIPSHGSSRKAIQEDRSDGQEDETEKVSVAIASLVGTNKKITMLKKPECPPKPTYQKIVHARPLVNKPPPATLRKDHTEVEKLPPPKKLFQHRIPVGSRTSIVTSEASDSFSMASTSSETYSKISEETIRPSLLSSVLELDETYSKKSSESSSLKSISEYVGETTGISRSDVLKVHERSSFPQGRLQSYTSVQKMPSALHPRSIDEIIASLRSTFPTPSDLKIKELLESILGQDFSINMEIPDLLPAETETKDEILTHIPQPPAVKTETEPSELKSPAKEVTATETEQIELDISRSTRSESIFSGVQQEAPKEEDDSTDSTEVEAQEVMMETPRRKTLHIVTEPSEEALGLHEIEGVTFSEPEQIHGSAASPVQNVLEKSTTEEREEPLFSGILEVKGKAFPKTKPAEIQESLEDIQEEQPLPLLSTWTSDIKDVNYPLIHHLCMTYPRSVLPMNLQLASRVHHTLDKKGHCVLLPPQKLHYYESELEEFFPVTAAVTEQIEKERICNEGLPVSEVHQCNQKDGINVLPSPLPESMPEWQRVAEFYVEKPKLELLGKKVELHPASLKMFWTPAPQKFSAPLSVMKETVFSKYESNWINGVIYEDFSCDLREEEELESEDDFDNLLSNLTVSKRCYSCPQLEAEELKVEVIRGSISAPELSSYRDQGILNIDSNFKTTMEEMNVMKEHVSAKVKAMPSEAEGPPEKPQKLSLGPEKLSSGAEKPSPRADKDVVAEEDPDMIKKPKKDLFSPRVQQPTTSLDTNALAEVSRQAGMKYIVFPKQGQSKKSKKSDRFVTSEKLGIICETLNQPPRILLRATSLGELPTHNKFRIKVSQVVRSYRSPSLPSSLDFEKFAEKQGGIPENLNDYTWTRTIWNTWFDEVYPPSRPSSEDKNKIALDKKDLEKKKTVTEEKELTDLANLPPLEDKTDILPEFQSEIDRITLQIKENPSCAFSYCRRGAIYRKTGKLKAAMDDLEKAISLEPMLVNAYWHRHLLFLYQDKILLALEDLNFIIKCNKNHADAYLSRAAICRRQGNLSLAIINYTLAMRCRPTDDEIYYRRGEIHEEEGDILMAMDDYCKDVVMASGLDAFKRGLDRFMEEKTITRYKPLKNLLVLECFYYNPRRTDALMKHGIYYFEKCSWNIAINDFTAVIKEDPANAEARTFRGRAYIKQGKYTNAAEDFAAAIHLNPLNWIAYYHRGCLLRTIDPKQALQDLSISVLLNDNYENLSAFLHRGILYAELRQWMLAISDFRSAIFLDRMLTEAYINIGLIYMLHLERHFESIEQFTQAIRVNPLETRPYLCRAQAYHRIHDLKSAVRDINRAIHLQPNSPHLRLTRGQYLLEMKDYELASFCIHQVAQIGEGSFECSLVQEALVQSFCRNHNKAIECALKAARQQPDPPMFFMLGKLQMKARKHKDALASFKQALRLLTGPSKTVPNTFEAAQLYYYMGQCYMEQICLIEAFEAFTTAAKLYPRYADAYYERGLCRMQLQQTGAILDFNKVLAISPKHFQAYLSRAAYYGSKGRFSKAIVNCTEALKIYPNSVRAFLYRGTLKFYNRTYKHAIEDLNKAIAVDNVCILAHYNRAVSYHQMKDYKKALKDYGIVLLLEANKDLVLKVLINRALLYAELDQHANALEDLTEAALSKPKDSCLFKIIGICYHRLQKYEEAVNSFCKVLKLDPFCLDGYIGRGNAYMEYGHEEGTKRAQKDFLKAIHLNPVSLKARLCLGYNLQALGKFQKAWNQFSAAIQIDPNCHIAYDGRAIVCLQMGDTFAAFQDTNTALKITTNAELLTNRGVINQFMGYLTCAMKDYQQAITIDPGYALAYFNAANIYFFNRQFPQANDYYSKALVLDPKNESAFLNRAITNTLLKNFEEAKEDFEKAICLSPFSAAIYFNKANLYNTLEDYEQAEKDISQALSIQPYDALMHKLRADIRGKMGLIKEAITDYKNAISIQELISSE